MRLKAIADHNRVVRLEDWNGLDLTGGNDCSSILNAAMTQAAASQYPLLLPATPLSGGILIGSTASAVGGLTLRGAGGSYANAQGKTKLIPGMTDGSACISVPITAQGSNISDLFIGTSAANAAAATNCIGLKIGDVDAGGIPEDHDVSRSRFHNIQVSGVQYGFQALGWNNTFTELQSHKCALGFKGQFLNSGVLDLITEGCSQAFALKWSHALSILRLQDEGVDGLYASVIDASSDIIMLAYYGEQVGRGEVPMLRIGAASGGTTCRNIRILSGVMSACGLVTNPIELDDVDGYEIDVQYATGTNRRSLKRTALTRNEYRRHNRIDSGYPIYALPANTTRNAENYLPNENSEGLRHGCKNVYVSGVTLSEETTAANLRVGGSCTKVTLTAGATYAYEQLEFDDPWVLTELAGKTVTYAAWVYIPDVASMSAEPTPTIPPSLGIRAWASGPGSSDVAFTSLYALRAGWNLLSVKGVVPAGTTEIRLLSYVNRSSSTAGAGTEYILINGRYLCVGDVAGLIDEGRVVTHPSRSGRMESGRLLMRVTQAQAATMIADTTQTYKVGDAFEYTDPLAGQVEGKKLTTTGWKDVGVIAL